MVILKDINLIPKSVINKKQHTEGIRTGIIAVAILVGILIVVDSTMFLFAMSKKKQIEKQNAQIQTFKDAEVNADVINAVKKKIQYREDILKKVNTNQIKMSEVTDSLEQLVPKNDNLVSLVSLLKLSVDEKRTVTVQGKADKEEYVLDFYHNLKGSELSDYIEFDKISGTIGDTQNGFDFTLTFKLKTGSDKK